MSSSKKNLTDKQALEVVHTYFIWDGQQYLQLWDIQIVPSGEHVYMVENTHMSGSINGRRFITEEHATELKLKTREHINI